jgi:hypothetical protein
MRSGRKRKPSGVGRAAWTTALGLPVRSTGSGETMANRDRRQFLESVAAAGVAAFAGIRTLQAADALVDVNPSQLGPVIGSHL